MEPGRTIDISFWDHLDTLRMCIIKIVIITITCGIAAFFFKNQVFSIILAPTDSNFATYRFFNHISRLFMVNTDGKFSVSLINIGLAEQFMIHIRTSIYVGLLIASPFIIYVLFSFIAPALDKNESKYSSLVVLNGYLMFALGVLFSYFVIFPFTFRFLGTYQVSSKIGNMVSLQSYMDTFLMMNLVMGIVFEIPILCWLLGKFGILSSNFMKKYRKHAIIVILVVSAIITPTSDVFTLSLVAVPIWLLYECSIIVVTQTRRIS